jgi:hypothetical protein
MSLREQLAEKIYCAFWDGKPGIPTEVAVHLAATKHLDSGLPIDEAWLKTADECIRQMEWARGLYMKSEGVGPIKVVPGLTLAPEDWKP